MALRLKIDIVDKEVTKTLQFDPSTTAAEVCAIVSDKSNEGHTRDRSAGKNYGLFLPGDSNSPGSWLEPGKKLEYYMIRDGDTLKYRNRDRILKVKNLDGTNKSMLVDDSQTVGNLMVLICTKMGILNHDEYSLVREDIDEHDGPEKFATLTLRRKKEEKERDAKMEQLRKKIKVDDEINWVDHSKTLLEQGVGDNEVLLLKRKYFHADRNVTQNDPLELTELYHEAQTKIVDGTHPVTQEKACEFAGIQCQIQLGDHDERKHRPGFLELKEYLPAHYVKTKGIEKKIYMEHRTHMGLPQLEAKSLYINNARSLATYGTTFFLVKEKMEGKNKLVPRLIGVNKESVLRLDENTKEILKVWPLTTVKRWAASQNTFTLDFGDYAEHYCSFQTSEGEQIADLIAGYIDLILKKKAPKDHIGIEGNEGAALVEELITPQRATTVRRTNNAPQPLETSSIAKPVLIHAGAEGLRNIHSGHIEGPHYGTMKGQIDIKHTTQHNMHELQSATYPSASMKALRGGQEAIIKSREILDQPMNLPPIGNDPQSRKWKETTLDSRRQNIHNQIAAMNAATAHVVTITSTDEVDSGELGESVTAISSGLPEVANDVRMVAALMDDGGNTLINATKQLCTAFSELLTATDPEGREKRQGFINAASKVGEASREVLSNIGEDETKDILMTLAKAVANASAQLVVEARKCASTPNGTLNADIGKNAAETLLSASKLLACAKLVAPSMHNEKCRNELLGASRKVLQATVGVTRSVEACDADEGRKKDVEAASMQCSKALNDLMDHILEYSKGEESKQEAMVDTILSTTDQIMVSNDSTDMVRQARILAQATAELIQAIRGEAAEAHDSEAQRKLIAAAKVLAEATTRLVEAAKACAANPNAPNSQDMLRQAAQNLRDATNVAAGGTVQKKYAKRLDAAARKAANVAAQTIAAAQSAMPHCRNVNVKESLSSNCRAVADTIPELVNAVKSWSPSTIDSRKENMIEVTEKFIHPCNSLVETSKSADSFIADPNTARHLSQCSQKLAIELVELRTAVDRMKGDEWSQSSKPKKLIQDCAESVRDKIEEIAACKKDAMRHELRPLPGDNVNNAIQRLNTSVRKVGTCADHLTEATARSEEQGAISSSQGFSSGLTDLVKASRAVASTSNDHRVLVATEELLERSWKLMTESSNMLGTMESPEEKMAQLSPLTRGVHESLKNVLDAVPGHREIDESISVIAESMSVKVNGSIPQGTYGQVHSQLQGLASEVADSSGKVVQSVGNPPDLAYHGKTFASKTGQLIRTGFQLSHLHQDVSVKQDIAYTLKDVASTSTDLLVQAKTVSTNPDAGMKNRLFSAARALTESLNQLINACSSAAPGQKECDSAIRRIEALKPLLDNPVEPINHSTFFDCQDIVASNSHLLGESMTGIAHVAKEGELESFGTSVNSAADAICGFIESSAQAAYLLAVSDSSSVARKPGIIDAHVINDSHRNIISACQTLLQPNVSQDQVLNSATVIARHTSAVCTACRSASEKTNDASTKRQFVQMAKDVANATAILVREIKTCDSNSENCRKTIGNLNTAIDALVNYSNHPDFAGVPARISAQGRALQEPIISSGLTVIDSSCSMLGLAKLLAMNPKDPPTWHQLAQHSKLVSDSIKKIVNALREGAPGQKECEFAVKRIQDSLRHINEASMLAVSQKLTQNNGNTLRGFLQNSENAVRNADSSIDPLLMAAKSEAHNLGHKVGSLISVIEAMISNVIGLTSHMVDTNEQVNLLEKGKTVLESAVPLICTAKECGGNPNCTKLHQELHDTAQGFREGLRDLKCALDRVSSGAGTYLTSVSESITSAVVKLNEHQGIPSDSNLQGYVDYQSRMVISAKEIARLSNEMASKATVDAGQVPKLSQEIGEHYNSLAVDARGAIATAVPSIGRSIRCSVVELGQGCSNLVRHAGTVQLSPDDQFAQRELSTANKTVCQKVSEILATLQEGSRGTQACINAASTVSGIIGDLDTNIMFATAGTLHADGDESFAEQKENIFKMAKALVEDTKTLVVGAASTQEQLAGAAQNAVSTIVQLAEAVKFGAESLGSSNSQSQVMLLNAVRDVAGALYDMIHATKSAAGKGPNDPSMVNLKESAKELDVVERLKNLDLNSQDVEIQWEGFPELSYNLETMVTNVTSLLKTVRAVEDEHSRGTRALESTIEGISQEIRGFEMSEMPKGKTISPEDLVRATKPVTLATAKAMAAGASCKQDDVIIAANTGRKAIGDLLTSSKIAAASVDGDMRARLMSVTTNVATKYHGLLKLLLEAVVRPGSDLKMQMGNSSKEIAEAVTEFVAVGQLMKVVDNQIPANPLLGHAIRSHSHSTHQGNDFEDPNDPTVIAENELLRAANTIDAAAKKLEKLTPRRKIKEADETLNFDDMILEAAKAIAAATSALVKAATAAQRELVDSGIVNRKAASDSDDGQWSEGLVSAAQLVAAATHTLVEAANALVQGQATEEKLISAAQQVASCTTQLVVACKVKASPDSDAQRRLQDAGSAVIRATDNLVRAAQKSLAVDEERRIELNTRMVGGIAQEINARSEVLEREKQLEEARTKLAAIRKAKYKDRAGGPFGDEDDIDGSEFSRLNEMIQSSENRLNNSSSSTHMLRQQQLQSSSSTTIQSRPQHFHHPQFVSNQNNVRPASPSGASDISTFSGRNSGVTTPLMERKMNNISPSFHGESVTQCSFRQGGSTPPPPPPVRSFPQVSSSSPHEDIYSTKHLRQEQHYSATSSASSTPAPTSPGRMHFKKPSEFVPPKGGKQVLPSPSKSSLQRTNNNGSSSSVQEESYRYDSGPIETETTVETRRGDGGISIKRVTRQEQSSSSTTSTVTSSRSFFQQKANRRD